MRREAKPASRGAKPTWLSPQPTLPVQDEFAATRREIKGVRPEVPHATLECDADVVRATLPEIQKAYEASGFKENAQTAALTGWKEVRLGSPLQPNKCMVSTSYTAYMLSLGRLNFKTNPGDADIALDGKSMSVKTLHSRLFEADVKHKVRFSKPGYVPVEIECMAVERKETDCFAELKVLPAAPLPFASKPVVKKRPGDRKARGSQRARPPRPSRRRSP
ncbi:MAG TPA: hypothetical protein VGW12_13150 [Pyrinomonadaceae bacterium]|nr:hypothetical protein [Pyrinomonadaceae bacterium]